MILDSRELIKNRNIIIERYGSTFDCDDYSQVISINTKLAENTYLIFDVCLSVDAWNFYFDDLMCSLFDVELVNYMIDYSAHSGFDNKYYIYRYVEKGRWEPLNFYERYDKLNLIHSDGYSDADCDARALTHKILKCLRELDNRGVDWKLYLEDRDLRHFLFHVEELMEHFKGDDV